MKKESYEEATKLVMAINPLKTIVKHFSDNPDCQYYLKVIRGTSNLGSATLGKTTSSVLTESLVNIIAKLEEDFDKL